MAWYEPYIDGAAWKAAWESWNPAWTADDVRVKVEAYLGLLKRQRRTLERARGQLRTAEDQAAWQRHHTTYAQLVAPIAADSQPAASVGAGPAVVIAAAVIVGGLALGAWAVAWAVDKLSLAYSTTQAIELWQRDLEVRWEAAQQGVQLPSTTLPGQVPDPTRPSGPQGDGKGDGPSWWWALLGLALLAGGGAAYQKFQRG